VTVVVGCLDQQAPRVRGPRLGDVALRARFSSEVYSLGTMPRKPDKSAGFGKRVKSPTSAHSPAAVSVSMLRKQRSRPTVSAWLLLGTAA